MILNTIFINSLLGYNIFSKTRHQIRSRAIVDDIPRSPPTIYNKWSSLPLITFFSTHYIIGCTQTQKCEAEESLQTEVEKTANSENISQFLHSDEFTISFSNEKIGLSLVENSYKGFPIVVVKSFSDPQLPVIHKELRSGAIVTHIQGQMVAALSLNVIASKITESGRPMSITFRDPSRYFELLDSADQDPNLAPVFIPRASLFSKITSEFLPAGTRGVGTKAQILEVQRLFLPPPNRRGRSSRLLDVMEIRYAARVVKVNEHGAVQERGPIVDTSEAHAPPGYSIGSIFYVLGQGNGSTGPVPPGWDYTLRGMVVGEKRRVVLPPALAFDLKGLKDENGVFVVSPGDTIEYVVELVSLTG